MRRIILILPLLPAFLLVEHAQAQTWRWTPEDAPSPGFSAAAGRPDPRIPGLAKVLVPPVSLRSELRAEPFSVEVRLPALDHEVLLAQDAAAPDSRKRLRNGIRRDLRLGGSAGQWQSVEDIGQLWTVALVSEGAFALRLHFAGVNLPPGAELRVWSPDAPDVVDGPFIGKGPSGDGQCWSTVVKGERVYVEFVSPTDQAGTRTLPFEIDALIHFYRDFFAPGPGPREGDCHNDSSCYPDWATVRNAVARFTFVDNGTGYLCTGQLLDTEAGDLTPYFLTANHCCGSPEVAQTVVVYWFHQSNSCNGTVPPVSTRPTSAVADLVGTSGLSDYALLLIRGELPVGVFWSGWTTAAIPFGTPSTSIHHPGGTFQRISFGVRGASVDDFWRIDWTDGPTEPGSSGAGIWRDDTQQLYGQLCCGDSACGRETWDYYGKFSAAYPHTASFLAGGSDDDLEDNDSCAGAVAIDAGLQPNRIVKVFDEDWHVIDVPGCTNLEIAVSFSDAYGDIDLELYDGCGGGLVAASTGTGNGEAVSIPASDVFRTYWLRVYLASDTRNTYDLTVALTGVGSDTRVTDYDNPGQLPVLIPDNNPDGVTRSLAIPDRAPILDLDLDLQIEHTWNGDLVVELMHGEIVSTVIDRPGRDSSGHGFDNDGFDITLDDAAGTSIETYNSGGPKVTGRFSPAPNALSLFNGMDRAGTWTLRVSDHQALDRGRLLGWVLRITTPGDPVCRRTDAAADVCLIVDDRIDLIDLTYHQTCFTGEGTAELGSCCATFDYDADDDVDLDDYAVLWADLTGPVE